MSIFIILQKHVMKCKHNQYLLINYAILFWLMSYSLTDYVSLIGSIGSIVLCVGAGYNTFLKKYFHVKKNIKIRCISRLGSKMSMTQSHIYTKNQSKRHLYKFEINTDELFKNKREELIYKNPHSLVSDIDNHIKKVKEANFGKWDVIKAGRQTHCGFSGVTLEECNISQFEITYKIKIIGNWYKTRSHYVDVEFH